MYRYIAFAWNTQVPAESVAADSMSRRLANQDVRWSPVLCSEGLHVFQIGSTPPAWAAYVLNDASGVILGKLFTRQTTRDGSGHEVCFDEKETDRIRATDGRHLIECYWGRYVALLKAAHGPKLRVLRDPTGAMPCFVASHRGIHVICSNVEDCASIGLLTGRINWEHVIAYLHFNHMVTSHTGLTDVRQVQAGECLTVGERGTRSAYYWSPAQIHHRRELGDRRCAKRELRNAIQACVSAWAGSYMAVLHELSGGLDSAIVLACLSRSPGQPRIVCENHFTSSAAGDERMLARRAAQHANAELIELPIRFSDEPLIRMFETRRVATPTLTAFVPETQSVRERIVKERGIEAVFSGQGGDHFFQSVRTPHIAAEYAWRRGVRRELFTVMAETARFTRQPIWSVIGVVIGHGLLRRQYDPYDALRPSPLLSTAAREAIDPGCLRHPWIETASDLPSCKRLQVFSIIDTQNFYRIPSHYADIVHPLISQPIIELCLQVPSYVLTYGGIDRALVRDAFGGIVPSEILSRTLKGATTGHFNTMLIRWLPDLREFLLGGLLVAEDVLGRQETDAALRESSLLRRPDQTISILDAVRAEFWVRSWKSYPA